LSRAACERFYLWPLRLAGDLALEQHVPDQERGNQRGDRWPPHRPYPVWDDGRSRQGPREKPPRPSGSSDLVPCLGRRRHGLEAQRQGAENGAVLVQQPCACRAGDDMSLDPRSLRSFDGLKGVRSQLLYNSLVLATHGAVTPPLRLAPVARATDGDGP